MRCPFMGVRFWSPSNSRLPYPVQLTTTSYLPTNWKNKVAKVLATCVSYCQKSLLLFTSLWPKILDNWRPLLTPKMQVKTCKEDNKLLLSYIWMEITEGIHNPWAEPPSLIEFHSINNKLHLFLFSLNIKFQFFDTRMFLSFFSGYAILNIWPKGRIAQRLW